MINTASISRYSHPNSHSFCLLFFFFLLFLSLLLPPPPPLLASASPSPCSFVMDPRFLTFGGVIGYCLFTNLISFSSFFFFLLFLVLLALYFLYFYQSSLLYQPRVYPQFIVPSSNPFPFRSPSDHHLPYENLYLTTPDQIKIHCWFIRPSSLSARFHRPTILFFPANASNIGFRLENIKEMYEEYGANVLILSYRGYGESEGQPNEEGILLDCTTVFSYMQQRDDIDRTRIYLFGRSLGGNCAIALAKQYDEYIAGTIIENSFTSISEMVDSLFPLLSPIKRFLLTLKWEGKERIKSITHPILFISGGKDEVVPPPQMKELFNTSVAIPLSDCWVLKLYYAFIWDTTD